MGSKSNKRKPTSVDLLPACDALGYELAALHDAAILCSQGAVLGIESLRNTALESLVLHTRLLIEFFYNKSSKGHFRAEDFFDNPEDWRSHRDRSDELEWLSAKDGKITVQQLEGRCNAHAAHLGWNRVLKPDDANWHARSILVHFDVLASRFLESAPLQHLTLESVGTLNLGPSKDGTVAIVTRYRWRTGGPHTTYLPFITDFTGASAAALDLLATVRAFGIAIMEQTRHLPSPSPVRPHVMVFIARSTNCLDSVEALFRVGQADDAFSVMRTICELTIDLGYILKGDTERRFELFFGFEHLVNFRQAEFIHSLHGGAESEAFLELRSRRDKVIGDYPNEYRWIDNSLGRRAREASLAKMYESIYAEGCSAVHSGPVTLRNAYTDNNGQLELYLGPRRPESARVIELALFCYLRQLAIAIDFLGLSEEISTACDALFERLQTLPSGED